MSDLTRVRGKFFVLGIEKSWPGSTDVTIKLGAVSRDEKEDSENTYFHRATPYGEIKMQVTNPEVAGFFELGQVMYVDFVKVADKTQT